MISESKIPKLLALSVFKHAATCLLLHLIKQEQGDLSWNSFCNPCKIIPFIVTSSKHSSFGANQQNPSNHICASKKVRVVLGCAIFKQPRLTSKSSSHDGYDSIIRALSSYTRVEKKTAMCYVRALLEKKKKNTGLKLPHEL